MLALPKMCAEWMSRERRRKTKERNKRKRKLPSTMPTVAIPITIWLVSVRLRYNAIFMGGANNFLFFCYNAIFMGGANNFLFPFGRFLIPVLRRTCLPPSHRNHPPPPGASVRSTFIVYIALKYVTVSARFHKRCDILQMDCVKTLPFLWPNDSNEISLGGC